MEQTTELEEGEILEEESTIKTEIETTIQPPNFNPAEILPPVKTQPKSNKNIKSSAKPKKPNKPKKLLPPPKKPRIPKNENINNDLIDPTIDVCENEEILRETRKNFTSLSKKTRKIRRKKYAEKSREKAAALKKQQCSFYVTGRCTRGANCQFGHFDIKIPEPCKLYSTTQCPKGSKCQYMHGDYPCVKFHLTGSCPDNQKCRFSHDELNEITEKIISKLSAKNNNEPETKQKFIPKPKINNSLDEGFTNTAKKRKNQLTSHEAAKRFATIFKVREVSSPTSRHPNIKNLTTPRFPKQNSLNITADVETKVGPMKTSKPSSDVMNNYYILPPHYKMEYKKLKSSLANTDHPLPPFENFNSLYTSTTPKSIEPDDEIKDKADEMGDWSENNPNFSSLSKENSNKSLNMFKPVAQNYDNMQKMSSFNKFGRISTQLKPNSDEFSSVEKCVIAAKEMLLSESLKDVHRNLETLKIKNEDDLRIVKSTDNRKNDVSKKKESSNKIAKFTFDSLQIPYEYQDDESLPYYARIPGILKRKCSFISNSDK